MIITPVTIYINVNVIFVESHNKADKGDYNIKHSFYGGDSVTSYDIDTSKNKYLNMFATCNEKYYICNR